MKNRMIIHSSKYGNTDSEEFMEWIQNWVSHEVLNDCLQTNLKIVLDFFPSLVSIDFYRVILKLLNVHYMYVV